MSYFIPERSLIPPETDDRAIGYCEACGHEIYVGYEYYEANGEKYCEECVNEDASVDDYAVVFATCPSCGEGIRTDEYFALVGGVPYCSCCVERCSDE